MAWDFCLGMKKSERIKIISAIVLLACMLLPISSCSRYVASGKHATTYNFPFESFDYKDIYDWLLLFAFMWPVPIIVYRDKGALKLLKNLFWGLEPLLIIGSSALIWFDSTLLAAPFIGAYLSISANCAYGMAWLSELLAILCRRCKCQRS